MYWPTEILALVYLKYFKSPLHKRTYEGPDVERCWELLKFTSRSFVAVIEELHPDMRKAVMIFYLILRGLDTIEDDTGLDLKVKLPLLRSFRRDVLQRRDWTFTQSSPTEKDRIVLVEFDVVLRVFHDLRPEFQDIIADITETMGNGMADYVLKESQHNYDGLRTINDYKTYCHYVAGIVGEGLTRMAWTARFVSPVLAEKPQLYDSMGLFLQMTNIIRDYREDLDDGRSFWPQEVWKKYATSLSDFKTDHKAGMHCVSELLLLSLDNVQDCLEYLANVREPSLFRFCAIPQVMSIATLELVFNNPAIFERNVKLSKGRAAELIIGATNMHSVFETFREYAVKIHQRNKVSDPNYFKIELHCAKIIEFIDIHDPQGEASDNRKALLAPQKTHTILGIRSFTDDEWEGVKIALAGTGMMFAVMLVMMGVAMLFGARYPSPLAILRGEDRLPHMQPPMSP